MRRQFIVDAKFQGTVVGYTIVVSLLTTMVHETIGRIELYNELQQRGGIVGVISAYIRPDLLKPLAYGSFYLGLLIVAVLFSNRLAGPLYRLRRHMIESAQGKQLVKLYFRHKDYYSELNKAYNDLADAVNRREKIQRSGEEGFSLTEVMVVTAIVSILAFISVATIFEKPKDEFLFRQDVSQLNEALLTARNAAVTKNQCAIVTANGVDIRIHTYPIPSPCDRLPLPDPDMQVTQTFRSGTTIGQFSTGPTLVFRPNGGTTAAGPVTITMTTSGGLTNRFTIYPAIGQVRHL